MCCGGTGNNKDGIQYSDRKLGGRWRMELWVGSLVKQFIIVYSDEICAQMVVILAQKGQI